MSIYSQLHANLVQFSAGPLPTILSIPSPGWGSNPTRVLPAGHRENPERGTGATFGGLGTDMLSRPSGL